MPNERPQKTRRFPFALRPERPVLWLAALVIGVLLAASAGFVWNEREQALQQAEATATRRASRLAQDLSQSLALARHAVEMTEASISQGPAAPDSIHAMSQARNDLLSVLALPFELVAVGPNGQRTSLSTALQAGRPPNRAAAAQTAESLRWQVEVPDSASESGVLPLLWPVAGDPSGIQAYRVELSLGALLKRLEDERTPPGGGAALFRLDSRDQVTVLARAPHVASRVGSPIGGWLGQALGGQHRGVFSTPGEIDGIARRTAFQRLDAPADSLVVAYGFSVDDVLAGWSRRWPWVALFTALLSLAVGWGGWRLDCSLTRQSRSELRLRLALASGQVWEWNLRTGELDIPEVLWRALGHPASTLPRSPHAFEAAVFDQDLAPLRQHLGRHFKEKTPLATEFRLIDVEGGTRWIAIEGQAAWNAAGRAERVAGTVFDTTERHRLAQEQRQLLQHLDTVANASAALAWTIDAQRRTDWVNQAWREFTGRDLHSARDACWLEDVHPQDRQRCDLLFSSAFAAHKPYSMEYRLRQHDGRYRWLHEQGKPRYDADHRFIGYVGSGLDVTELREAEAAAQERGDMLQQVFDVLRDMLFVVDAQERFVFFQAGSEERLYRQPEDFLGRTIGEVLPPPLVPQLREAMAQARSAGLQELDYSLDLPAGTHHFNARLAWLPNGGQCMFLVRDVTEQHRNLQERERLSRFVLLLFRLATGFINLPVQQMDAAIQDALGDLGRFVGADRAYLFDYDFEACTSSNTHEWCAEGIAAEIAHLKNIPMDQTPDWATEHRRGAMVHVPDLDALPDGPLKRLLQPQGIQSLITLPLISAEGCLGFVGLDSVRRRHVYDAEEITLLQLFAQMLVNVQERSRAQARLRELTEQLEQKVDERTRQLNDSVHTLEAVNRELESFTYSASHDLRTPLRGIEGFSALLLQEHAQQLDDQGREYLQRIQRATLHMSRLVNDLLAYSRLQQLTEQIGPLALASSVQGTVAAFRDELEARQGQLTVQIPENLQVQADPRGLAIVLRNLIDNALKFTPAGDPPRLLIEAQAADGRVRLRVTDHGIGFDMKHHDKIFGMFQRLHRQDQIPGTGIGLALVHKAVERMGGQIRAESSPGQGTTFHIELPQG